VFSGIFYLLKIKIKTETKKETKIAKKEKIHKSAENTHRFLLVKTNQSNFP
jgi:hypothetical protein